MSVLQIQLTVRNLQMDGPGFLPHNQIFQIREQSIDALINARYFVYTQSKLYEFCVDIVNDQPYMNIFEWGPKSAQPEWIMTDRVCDHSQIGQIFPDQLMEALL